MKIDSAACEYYKLAIDTTPATAPTDWEASIDDGTTYVAATEVDDKSAWLVAGPDYEGGSTPDFVTANSSESVKVRLIDNPETVIRPAPRITTTGL